MKIVLTGATGFIGKPLCGALQARGHDVVVLSRQGQKAAGFIGQNVTLYSWSPESEPAPPAAFDGAGAVIHLAGEPVAARRWSEAQKRKIYDSRMSGTRHLMDGLSASSPNHPLILLFASAIGYYGYQGDSILSESSPPGSGFLANVCVDWERESKRSIPNTRQVNIRIGIVLGKRGGVLKKLLPIFKVGLGGPIGDGKQWMSWIHLDDLIQMFLFSLENQEVGGILNGVAPSPVTNAEFSKILARVLHRPSLVTTPTLALKLGLGEMSELVLGSQRVIPNRAAQLGFRFLFTDLEAALANILNT